mmetsp:Transcript_4407/g.7841  ORF Transcript_4407/g.7841 Transcript_4407/m.7841 type:complete len:254 (-) Transcript_4407:1220-1981(-)
MTMQVLMLMRRCRIHSMTTMMDPLAMMAMVLALVAMMTMTLAMISVTPIVLLVARDRAMVIMTMLVLMAAIATHPRATAMGTMVAMGTLMATRQRHLKTMVPTMATTLVAMATAAMPRLPSPSTARAVPPPPPPLLPVHPPLSPLPLLSLMMIPSTRMVARMMAAPIQMVTMAATRTMKMVVVVPIVQDPTTPSLTSMQMMMVMALAMPQPVMVVTPTPTPTTTQTPPRAMMAPMQTPIQTAMMPLVTTSRPT